MNAATIKAKLLAMRAEVDGLLEEVDRQGDGAPPDPIYLTPEDYAERAHVSVETVRRWVKAGIPHVRRGRVVRIKVAEADAWTPAEGILRSAKHEAHRGTR